ncbi:hypothetical protein ACFXJ5_09250 [Streptomyces sp. NPDC059373]
MDWQQAMERADQIAAHGFDPPDTWDGRAIRGVLTVTFAGLARRQGRAVPDVETGSVLWHLDQGGPALVYELGEELDLNAEDAQPVNAASQWAWLTRSWPGEPGLTNSDGMPRGIGRGAPLPAVDVCTLWAAAAARDALIAERPAGLAPRTRVRVTGGDATGRTGEVIAPAWLRNDELRTIKPGPPHGYQVALTAAEQHDETRHIALAARDGEVSIDVPGPPGEVVIIHATDLAPVDQ